MNVDHLSHALDQAGSRTAKKMTAALRRQAFEAGWPRAAGRRLRVEHNQGEFSIVFPEEAQELVHDYEFGTQDRPPTAVLRKFSSRFSHFGTFFHQNAVSHLKGE